MSTDVDSAATAAPYWSYDCLRSARPRRIERPKTLDALRALLRELSAHNAQGEQKVHATVRASYNSLDGQALNDDVLIDLSPRDDAEDNTFIGEYSSIGEIDAEGRVWVGAFTMFRPLLHHTVARGWMLPSMPTGPEITVGGSIAAGGISRFAHVWGTEQAQVLALDVVTGDGELHEGIGRADPLFKAIAAGHGWVGIVLRARLQLRRVCEPGQKLYAETKLSKHRRDPSKDVRSYFACMLGELFNAGESARNDHRTGKADVFDAQSMVGFLDGDEMIHYQSRWVTSPSPDSRGALDIYSGLSSRRLIGELVVSVPRLRWVAEWIYFRVVKDGIYTNDWDPFAFFFEGNVELRRRLDRGELHLIEKDRTEVSSASPEFAAMLNDVESDLPQGVAGKLYALQQTHLLPDLGSAADFLAYCHAKLPKNRRDRPTVIDLLYLPGCADGPYLGTSGEHGGFAVTVAWQEILRDPSGMNEEKVLAGQLALEAERLIGKVSMLKSLWCERGLVRRVYGAAAVDAFEAVRAQHDPQSVLQNEFYERHLGR